MRGIALYDTIKKAMICLKKKYIQFIITLLLLVLSVGKMQGQNGTESVFSMNVVRTSLSDPEQFKPIPKANDSFWHHSLPLEIRVDYINLGHSFKGTAWDIIPDSLFAEYRENGNRTNYESLCFGYRRKMICLVLAEIMEHKGSLINDILNGLEYYIHETWWGVPAHYPSPKPEAANQVVDLFNSETACMLAWTIYMLNDELEKEKSGICEMVKKEINRRLLIPARTHNYGWKTSVDNWNTWICANWLSCILLCEKDRDQQIADIGRVLACLEFFFKGYPEDGGCDEGLHYWDRAAASLYESVRMLSIATDGVFSIENNPKFRAMGNFVYKTYISKNANVNFSDASANTQVNINILYPYGQYLKDSMMMGYAAQIAKENNYKHFPTQLFLRSDNGLSLSRELFFLYDYKKFDECSPREPISLDIWLPDLQFFTSRSNGNSTEGLFVAAKGGNNAESHNHNDIGSFIIYSNSEPLFIDIGVATYNSKTFSNQRYELMNCRSAYHNVPLINGFEQNNGYEYKAYNVKCSCSKWRSSFSLNLEKAYPSEANVKKWRRTIRLNRGDDIEIIENFTLNKFQIPNEIVLISYREPIIEDNGRIAIKIDSDTHYLSYNSKQLTPKIEKVQIDDPNIISSWHKKTLYRIRLIVSDKKLKGKIKYRIQ